MTKEEILEQQLEAMEKLLQLKQAIIDELESKIQRIEREPYVPPYTPYQPWTPPTYGPIHSPISLPKIATSSLCNDGTINHDFKDNTTIVGTSTSTYRVCSKCGAIDFGSLSGSITIGGGGTTFASVDIEPNTENKL